MELKYYLLCLIMVYSLKPVKAQTENTDSVYMEYVKTINITTNSFNKLLPVITRPGSTIEQKLKLVYYWVYEHIDFDTQRFLLSGPLQPLSTEETLKSGKALCYEYNSFVSMACNYLKIQGFDIEGYVKYYGFEPGGKFTQNNHVWHALYINGNWKMIDLLWGSGSLSIKGDNYKFKKSLKEAYFLASPGDFLKTHLPADPVFQLQERPLTMEGFTAKDNDEIDEKQHGAYINYADSIQAAYKLSVPDGELKSALRAYNYNPANADQLIIIYYNNAVNLVNNEKAPQNDLVKARSYFSRCMGLIDKSSTSELKKLLPICERAIVSATKRLKKV